MDVPVQLLQVVGTLASGILLAIIGQWGSHRIQAMQAQTRQREKEADVEDHREERVYKAESGLRAELTDRIRKQDDKIDALTTREDECRKRLIWLQQWLYVLHAACKEAGIVIDLPAELTLEGFAQPHVERPAYIQGVRPERPDIPLPGGEPPPSGGVVH